MLTELGIQYAHMAAADATLLVRTGPANLHTITLNRCATTSGYVTVYDGLTAGGTVIGIFQLIQNMVPACVVLDVHCKTGIFLGVTTAVGHDITVSLS